MLKFAFNVHLHSNYKRHGIHFKMTFQLHIVKITSSLKVPSSVKVKPQLHLLAGESEQRYKQLTQEGTE